MLIHGMGQWEEGFKVGWVSVGQMGGWNNKITTWPTASSWLVDQVNDMTTARDTQPQLSMKTATLFPSKYAGTNDEDVVEWIEAFEDY